MTYLLGLKNMTLNSAEFNTTMPRPKLIFWLFFSVYLLAFISALLFALHQLTHPAWLIVGLIIGSIYVFIAFSYFYKNFLTSTKINNPHIYYFMGRWIIPAIVTHIFVILGFWITLATSPLMHSVYTQPYKYGQLYKKLESAQKNEGQQQQFYASFSGYLKTHSSPLSPETIELKIYSIPFLIAMTFGFLGTLIYTLRDTAYRLYTTDLYPQTFVNYLIRFIFAPALCMVIAYFLMNDWWINAAPLIFFFVGFFPQRALQYMEEKTMNILRLSSQDEKQHLPLERLQGMTDYLIYRFKEIGIGDVQNLAYVDLGYLDENVGYNNRLLGDFVAQALLCVYLKEDCSTLQNFGIRDIITFKTVVNQENYTHCW